MQPVEGFLMELREEFSLKCLGYISVELLDDSLMGLLRELTVVFMQKFEVKLVQKILL